MNGAERRERSLRSGLCDGRSAMEEIFARRKARLMELRARRKGEDGEPKRLAARPVFDK